MGLAHLPLYTGPTYQKKLKPPELPSLKTFGASDFMMQVEGWSCRSALTHKLCLAKQRPLPQQRAKCTISGTESS